MLPSLHTAKPVEFTLALFLLVVSCMLGILTFNQPGQFEYVYIVALCSLMLTCIKNPNAIGIILILLFERLIGEIYWRGAFQFESGVITFSTYAVLGFLAFYFIADKSISYISLAILIGCLGAEFYWYATDYSKPRLDIYIYNISIAILIKHLIFARVFITRKLGFEGFLLRADFDIRSICNLYTYLNAVMIFEYFIRHILQTDSMIIYNSYTAIVHTLNLATLFFVFQACLSNHNDVTFKV